LLEIPNVIRSPLFELARVRLRPRYDEACTVGRSVSVVQWPSVAADRIFDPRELGRPFSCLKENAVPLFDLGIARDGLYG
jgi:hypothetical protein